ncbi:ABC transporter permease [Streptomyces specialis]|uniref:ABC transporter permease n=1 Tax=Streptomyces specialis TaxID=498367 RepID=UPI00073EA15D|nr:ABC transporter permease [Streptomyces specialis]
MIFTYLRRELRRRRKAQFVIAAGLALGIALVVVVNAVSSGMQRAQDEVLESLYGLGTDMTVSKAAPSPEEVEDGVVTEAPRFRFDAEDGEEQGADQLVLDGFQTLDASEVAEVAALDGVADAAGGLKLRDVTVSGSFDPGEIREVEPGEEGGAPGRAEIRGGGADFGVDEFAVFGADVTRTGIGPLSGTEITDGRALASGDADAAVAVLDADWAASEELAVGDTVTLKGTDFEIVGLAAATTGDATADVYIPLGPAQELSGNEDKLTEIYVQATDSQRLDAVEAAITDVVDDVDVTTADDLADQVSGSLSTAADLADGVGRWLSYLVLAVSFLVAGLMASSAVSRRVREFGTLKALGWTRGRITGQVMSESLATGLIGGALGLGAGLLAAWTITAIRPGLTAELGAATAGPETAGGGRGGGGGGGLVRDTAETAAETLDVGLTAPVSLSVLTLAVVLAVLGGLIAGAFAAWRAARLRPADALRRVA